MAQQSDNQRGAVRTGQQDVNQQAERNRQQEQQTTPGGQADTVEGRQRDLNRQRTENLQVPGDDKGQVQR